MFPVVMLTLHQGKHFSSYTESYDAQMTKDGMNTQSTQSSLSLDGQ